MLASRKQLLLACALAFAASGGMAADPGDAGSWMHVDPTVTSAAYTETMFADLTPCCDGFAIDAKGTMLAKTTYSTAGKAFTNFTINTKVAVPNEVEGFQDILDVFDADVRVQFARKGVGIFAECLLVFDGLEPDKPGDPESSAVATAQYALKMVVRHGQVLPVNGVCDIDLAQPGIQAGIPEMQFNDVLETMNVMPGHHVSYLRGYCE